jgi:hypothetical protein
MALVAQGADIASSVEEGLGTVVRLLPTVLMFLLVLIVGYFIAKAVAGLLAKVLQRVGFDRAVERGGVKQALQRSQYDASDILGKVVFYGLFLFVLQLAFGLFGPNPISDLITGVISYLPRLFVAILIVVIGAAVAAAVKEIVEASLGGLSYGRVLALAASTAILVVAAFAALDQLGIAESIVQTAFTGIIVAIAGVTIVAVGGGGIQVMAEQWRGVAQKLHEEAPNIRQEASGAQDAIKQRAQERKQQAQESSGGEARTVRLPEEQTTVRPR